MANFTYEGSTTLVDEIDLKKITFKDLRKHKDNKGRMVPLYYMNSPWLIEFPVMLAPFAVSEYQHEKNNPNCKIEYSLSLSFRGMEEDKSIRTLFEKMHQLADTIVREAGKHADWFGLAKSLPHEVLKANFYHPVQYSREKNGELKDLPPTIRLKFPQACYLLLYDLR